MSADEEIKFDHPNIEVSFLCNKAKSEKKRYSVIVKDKLIFLERERDEEIIIRLETISAIRYREEGFLKWKKGIVEIYCGIPIALYGPANEMRQLYQILLEAF